MYDQMFEANTNTVQFLRLFNASLEFRNRSAVDNKNVPKLKEAVSMLQ